MSSLLHPDLNCSLCLLLLVLETLTVLCSLLLIGLLLVCRKNLPLSSELGDDLSDLEARVLCSECSTVLVHIEHVCRCGLLGTLFLVLLASLLASLLGLLLRLLLAGLLASLLGLLLGLLLASLLGGLLAGLLASLLCCLLGRLLGLLLGKLCLCRLLEESQKVLLEVSAVATLNTNDASNVTKLLEVAVGKTGLHLGTSKSRVVDNAIELTDVALQDSGLGRCTVDGTVKELEGLIVVLALGDLLGTYAISESLTPFPEGTARAFLGALRGRETVK